MDLIKKPEATQMISVEATWNALIAEGWKLLCGNEIGRAGKNNPSKDCWICATKSNGHGATLEIDAYGHNIAEALVDLESKIRKL